MGLIRGGGGILLDPPNFCPHTMTHSLSTTTVHMYFVVLGVIHVCAYMRVCVRAYIRMYVRMYAVTYVLY